MSFLIANWNCIMVSVIKSKLPLTLKIWAFNQLKEELNHARPNT